MQATKGISVELPTVPSREYELCWSVTLKLVLLESNTPIPMTLTANINWPVGLVMMLDIAGSP